MIITGCGAVGPWGAGMEALKASLLSAQLPVPAPFSAKEALPVLQVPADVFKNPLLAPVRRADRFTKMTLLAALEAWQGATADPARVGIIVASACGPHGTVFKFVNDLLEFGESKSSPTVFSQSVHAAAASMIASTIKTHGPVLNLADLQFPFESALTLADAWLEEGLCDTVLVGATEELSEVYIHAVSRLWGRRYVPGEGSFFFRCERNGQGPSVRVTEREQEQGGVYCLENPSALGGTADAGEGTPVDGFLSRGSGSLRIGGAFLLAVAAWLRRGVSFPSLPQDGHATGPVHIMSRCDDVQRVVVVE